MPTNYPGGDAFPANVRIIADGDPVSAAGSNPPLQDVADRSTFLKAGLDFLATGYGAGARAATDGVKKLRRVTSLANLKALTGMVDGEICWVDHNGPYVYLSGAATASDEPWVAVPTTAPGRWFLAHQSLINAAQGIARLDAAAKVPAANLPRGDVNGVASLDGSTKVPVAQIPNAIFSIDQDESEIGTFADGDESFFTTTLAVYQDITGISITTPSLNVGDKIFVQFYCQAKCNAASSLIKVVAGATDIGIAKLRDNDNLMRPYHILCKILTVAGAGTVTLKAQAKVEINNGTNTIAIGRPALLRYHVIRA